MSFACSRSRNPCSHPLSSRGRVIYPLSAAFHGRTADLPNGIEKFFKKVLKNTKCARLQGADGRKGNVSSIQMI